MVFIHHVRILYSLCPVSVVGPGARKPSVGEGIEATVLLWKHHSPFSYFFSLHICWCVSRIFARKCTFYQREGGGGGGEIRGGRGRGRGNASTRREHERQDSGGGIGKIYTQYTGYMYYYAVWDNPGEHIEVVPFTHAIGPISGDPAELFFNGF